MASVSVSRAASSSGADPEPRGQPPVNRQPGLDLLEPCRVVVPPLAELAESIGHLAGLVGEPLQGRDGLGQLGHRVRHGLEAARHPFEHLLGGMIGLVKLVVAARGRCSQCLGIGQQVRLPDELVVLAHPGIGRGQLVALELEQRPLPLPGLRRVDKGLPLPPQSSCAALARPIRLQRLVQAAEGVEQPALAVGIEQRPALVLAVDIHQLLAQPLEGGDRHRHPVHLGRAPPLRRDPAGDDQFLLVDRPAEDTLDLAPQRGVLDHEDRGGPGLLLARADQVGRGLPAEHQPECREQETLARPGLARPGAEPLVQLDLDVLDQRQVLHRKLSQHDERSSQRPQAQAGSRLDLQVPHVERDRFLDVLVPEGPVVIADELLVLVGDVHRVQMAVEGAILVEQEVGLAAVEPQRGDPAVVHPLDQGERVFRSPPGRLAEDAIELRAQVLDACRSCGSPRGGFPGPRSGS